jgi:hypothetical protein
LHDFRYAAVMLLAVAVMSVLLRRWQARLPLAGWQKLGLGIGGFCGAMLGAKLPFVLTDLAGLMSGASWLADGKTILCGIVGGYFGIELTKWMLDILCRPGRRGCSHRPPGVFRRRLLLRHTHLAALGRVLCQQRRFAAAAPDATL